MNLIVAPGILEQAIDESRRAYPNEACGLLVGRSSGERFIPVKNVSTDPHRYEMDPSELIAIFRDSPDCERIVARLFREVPRRDEANPGRVPAACRHIMLLVRRSQQVMTEALLTSLVMPERA